MKKAFEAIWEQGKLIPTESININEHTRLLVVVLEEPCEQSSTNPAWKALKGKYKGKLSSVNKFIQRKQEEKRLEG